MTGLLTRLKEATGPGKEPNIVKRCMAALQAKYILTDDEARGMSSIVLAVVDSLSASPKRPSDIHPSSMSINQINEAITALSSELARRALQETYQW